MLEADGIHATFFCQGLVAEKYPRLIKDVHAAGHEIATHGWSHKSVKKLGKEKFKEELNHSIRLLEDICGEKVLGHRAPDFSIDLEMQWVFEIMREAGLVYDSSIFPIQGKRYGSPECRVEPYCLDKNFWEIPLSTITLWGRRFPVLGGGYFRLCPYSLSTFFIKAINAENRPAIIYIHPYELDMVALNDADIPIKIRIHQGLFRSRIMGRLKSLFKEHKLISIRRLLAKRECSEGQTIF